MDCDLQDRPEEIAKLYYKAQEGYDVVLARRGRRRDAPLKRLTSWLFYKLLSYLAGTNYDPEVGNFRIVSRKVANCFRSMNEKLRFFGGLVDWMGFPTASVDVQHAERFSGKTTYTFKALWKLASETIIAYSDKPLKISIRFGFLMSFLALVYGVFIVYKALVYGSPITGWASLIASLYFLCGFIVSILGIIGIYLGKTFEETKNRPLYIVRRATLDE
jgi:hypothetical protein